MSVILNSMWGGDRYSANNEDGSLWNLTKKYRVGHIPGTNDYDHEFIKTLPKRDTHRVWFKVLLNPILRKFRYEIVSVFDQTPDPELENSNDTFIGYKLKKYTSI
jgi:hypothetical protein